MTTTPDEIITAFDQAILMTWGHTARREYIHRTDAATAKRWIGQGATLTIACVMFGKQMYRMKAEGHEPPKTLKIFDEHIEGAVRGSTGDYLSEWERGMSQWDARCRMFRDGLGWRDDLWGPRPGEMGCMAPRSSLERTGLMEKAA